MTLSCLTSTDEVRGLIERIYEYRKANARYPRSLDELRPIVGDVVSKHKKDSYGWRRKLLRYLVLAIFLPRRSESSEALQKYQPRSSHLRVWPVIG